MAVNAYTEAEIRLLVGLMRAEAESDGNSDMFMTGKPNIQEHIKKFRRFYL